MPRTLLIADDSITMQKVVSITFASEDFSVITAGTGEEALAKAREVRPDIVVADVAMPRGNGYELCQVLKNDPALRHIPVLLLVGTSEGFDQGRATAAQADGFINKPFDSQAMIDKVASMLGIAPQAAATSAPMPTVPLAPPAPPAASQGWPTHQRPTTIPAPGGGAASRPFVAPAPNRFSSPTTPGSPSPLGSNLPPSAGLGAPRPIPPTSSPSALPPSTLRPSSVPTGSVVRPPPPGGSPLPPSGSFAGFGGPSPQAPVPPVPSVPRAPTPTRPLPSLGTLSGPAAPLSQRPPLETTARPPSPAAPVSPPWALPPSPAGGAPRVSPPWPTPGASGVPTRPHIPQAGAELAGQGFAPPPPAPTSPIPAAEVPPTRTVTTAWAPTTVSPPTAPAPAPVAPPAPVKATQPPSVELSIDDDIGPIQESPIWGSETKETSQGFELDLQVGMDTPLSAVEAPHPIAAPVPLPAAVPAHTPAHAHVAAPASAPAAPPPAEMAAVRAPAADGGEAALKLALSQASREVIERIVWEVVPQLAEVIVREHVERLARERSK
jgi:CheY-like chemotaxis protein